MNAVSSTPLQSADLTGRQLGSYEVLLQLAAGGMATVYVARRRGIAGFERLVAIKVLHPHLAHDEEFISMFLDEARLAARIRNPNVVATLDISDTQGDGYFLVMDYVEGDHLGHLLRSAAKGGERLPVGITSRILMDALSGLHAAHVLTSAAGDPLDLVHRDLSPHNILVGADGVARITDFGVAKAQVRLSSTRDGQFKGKLSYMAPEQAASGQADQRSDLFSMGIVLWESLTGRRLFRGENNADVLNKILNPEVPLPSQLDPALKPFDAVTSKALALAADDRFQTAEEFLEAIETASRELGGAANPRTVGREVKRWLGDKIAREKVSIRNAIDALGRNELKPGVLPRPVGSASGSQPLSSRTGPTPATGEDATVGARPSNLEPEAPSPNRALVPIIGLLSLFLVGGGIAAWVLWPEAPVPSPDPVGAPSSATAPLTQEPGETAVDTTAPPTAADTASADAPADQANLPETPNAPASDETPDAEDADEPSEPAASSSRSSSRRRRHGRRSRRGGDQTAAPTPEPPQAPASRGGSGDDDLMLNPYRR